MDITDIPDQIAKAFKYSLRSRSAFALSLVTAALVFGIGYDLLYGFWYTRWHNVKDAEYRWPYFAGLVLVAIVLPSASGLVACLRARAQAAPFKTGQIGIAIAPFQVFSVSPETLGTANVLQALDIVSTQFFLMVENTLSEFEAAKDLKFRFLPSYINIGSEQEALQSRQRLHAIMVIWGSIIQRSRQPLEIRLHLQADPKTYNFSGLSVEEFPVNLLQHYIFLEAGKAAFQTGDTKRAQRLLNQSLRLAEQMDGQENSRHHLVQAFEESVKEVQAGGQISKAGAPVA